MSELPADYPFGGRISETVRQFAERQGVKLTTMRSRVNRGEYPIIQRKKGGRREINLWALYLEAKHNAKRYMGMVDYGESLGWLQ
ncbi:hypothetical protein AMS64_22020 [Aeromonas veronii]|nr:hypothetical protein AMS64_22020 [Aeromonas veronii]POG17274.1 DNA-binding protein [Aeromonas veronii]